MYIYIYIYTYIHIYMYSSAPRGHHRRPPDRLDDEATHTRGPGLHARGLNYLKLIA